MGRKLFEQTIESSPSGVGLTQRIAFGKVGQASKNMTLQNLLDWLSTNLASVFMKRSNNLSDLSNAATSRTNLDVYGKSETYTQAQTSTLVNAVNTKLGGLQVYCHGAISETGTIVSQGGQVTFTASKLSTGKYQIIHNKGDVNYIVVPSCTYFNSPERFLGPVEYSTNYFNVITLGFSDEVDNSFKFVMLSY